MEEEWRPAAKAYMTNLSQNMKSVYFDIYVIILVSELQTHLEFLLLTLKLMSLFFLFQTYFPIYHSSPETFRTQLHLATQRCVPIWTATFRQVRGFQDQPSRHRLHFFLVLIARDPFCLPYRHLHFRRGLRGSPVHFCRRVLLPLSTNRSTPTASKVSANGQSNTPQLWASPSQNREKIMLWSIWD